MDIKDLIFYMVLMMFFGAWWGNYKLRNKALCIFTRASGQEIKKFVTLQDHYVSFDNMDFEIVPDRARDLWYDEGLFGKLFPTWIKCYHLNSNDYLPESYKDGGIQWESPANRNLINSRNDMHGFMENQTPPTDEPKKSKMQKYLPWIIGAVACLALYYIYYQYNQIQALQNFINTMG